MFRYVLSILSAAVTLSGADAQQIVGYRQVCENGVCRMVAVYASPDKFVPVPGAAPKPMPAPPVVAKPTAAPAVRSAGCDCVNCQCVNCACGSRAVARGGWRPGDRVRALFVRGGAFSFFAGR